MNLDKIIDFVNSHSDWNKLEKVRYVYVELGKILRKNVKFFYSCFNKIGDCGYSYDEINDLYNNSKFEYSAICRDAANYLKYIFDNIGIESSVLRTVDYDTFSVDDKNIDIHHFFLCATIDNNRKIFLTLIPDIANINMSLPTKHFGNDINYEEFNGEYHYSKEIRNGNKIDYEDCYITNSIITPEELYEVDKKIGYLLEFNDNGRIIYDYSTRFFNKMTNKYQDKNHYKRFISLSKNNIFYSEFVKHLCGEDLLLIDINSIRDKDFNKNVLIPTNSFICASLLNYLNILEVNNKSYLKSPNLKEAKLYLRPSFLNYGNFFYYIKKVFDEDIECSQKGMFNEKGIICKFNKLYEAVENVTNVPNMNSIEKNIYYKNLLNCLENVCYLYNQNDINDNYIKNNGYGIDYIKRKIISVLIDNFEIGQTTSFNLLGVSEKNTIIEYVLNSVLNENFKQKNIKEFIKKSTLYDKLEDKYMLLIVIEDEERGFTILYDYSTENKLYYDDISIINLLDNDRYVLLSNQIRISSENIQKRTQRNR